MLRRRKLDTPLAIGIVSLVLFGVVMIYSASIIVSLDNTSDPQFYFKRQLMWVVLGLILMAVASVTDYRNWEKLAKWMLPACLILLLSVFVLGKADVINGAQRWINLGFFSFQPSEVVKLLFSVYLAAWFAQRKEEVRSWNTFGTFMGVVTVISLLMLRQPDFGTLTVIIVAAISIYVVAGMTWKQAVAGGLILIIGAAAALSVPYRRERVLTFLNPERDQSGASYQVKNISIAVGSGGWFGLGFGQSGQKRLFLPEPHTDSIFAIVVEELGFIVGALLVLAIFFVIYRCYRVALRAPDDFSRYLATGITTWFAYQSFLNLSAMLQLVPLKGLPLPFISYGGSYLLVTMVAAGVLLNISRHTTEGPVLTEQNKAAGRRTTARATKLNKAG